MKQIKSLARRNWFEASVFLIIAIACFLRFYNYDNRWGLAYDQAYGAIVGKYALTEGKIPLVGPFSSAGPFQTGGEWYWFIMLGTLLLTGIVNAPWIFLSFTSLVFVFLIIFLAKELIDAKFGILVGLMAAVSTSEIAQSFNLTNQSIIGLIALFAVYSSIKFLKKKKLKFLFFLGFSASLAITVHLQGAGLIFLVLITILFSGKPTLKSLSVLFSGLFLPFIPILLFDIQSDFVNSKNTLQYYIYDQYKISLDVLGRRWLTYVSSFWPSAWAHIIGGKAIIAAAIAIGIFFTAALDFFKKKLTRELTVLILSFSLMVIFLRYLRTPLFDSYLMFLHPFILLLAGWFTYRFYRINKIGGLFIIMTVLLFSFLKDISELTFKGNYSAIEAGESIEFLFKKFPENKFSVYSSQYRWADKNLILSLYLYSKGRIAEDGRKIGVVFTSGAETFVYPTLIERPNGYKILDLDGYASSELSKDKWVKVNPKQIYERTEEWYKM